MYGHIQLSGSGVLSFSLDPAATWQFEEVRLHLDGAGGAGDFTVTLQSHLGTAYNIVFNTAAMTSATDEHYQPTRPLQFEKGDKLLFAWANGSSKLWGLEIVFAPR